jgi:hypothetical protein
MPPDSGASSQGKCFRPLALVCCSTTSAPRWGIRATEERQRYLETGSNETLEETGSPAELIESTQAPAVEVVDAPEDVHDIETKDAPGAEAREVPATSAACRSGHHQGQNIYVLERTYRVVQALPGCQTPSPERTVRCPRPLPLPSPKLSVSSVRTLA